MWSPTHIQVKVLKARDLVAKGKGQTNDAYVSLSLGKEKVQTQVQERSTLPEWNEAHDLFINDMNSDIHVHVYNRNLYAVDNLLGQVEIPLYQFQISDPPNSRWYALKGKKFKKSDKPDKYRGEIELRIQFAVRSLTGSVSNLSKMSKDKKFGSLTKLSGEKFKLLSPRAGSFKDKKQSLSSTFKKFKKKKNQNTEGDVEFGGKPYLDEEDELNSSFASSTYERSVDESHDQSAESSIRGDDDYLDQDYKPNIPEQVPFHSLLHSSFVTGLDTDSKPDDCASYQDLDSEKGSPYLSRTNSNTSTPLHYRSRNNTIGEEDKEELPREVRQKKIIPSAPHIPIYDEPEFKRRWSFRNENDLANEQGGEELDRFNRHRQPLLRGSKARLRRAASGSKKKEKSSDESHSKADEECHTKPDFVISSNEPIDGKSYPAEQEKNESDGEVGATQYQEMTPESSKTPVMSEAPPKPARQTNMANTQVENDTKEERVTSAKPAKPPRSFGVGEKEMTHLDKVDIPSTEDIKSTQRKPSIGEDKKNVENKKSPQENVSLSIMDLIQDSTDNEEEGPKVKKLIKPLEEYSSLDPDVAQKYSSLNRDDLITLIETQRIALTKKDDYIQDIEGYLDKLLSRVMESSPQILQNPYQTNQFINNNHNISKPKQYPSAHPVYPVGGGHAAPMQPGYGIQNMSMQYQMQRQNQMKTNNKPTFQVTPYMPTKPAGKKNFNPFKMLSK